MTNRILLIGALLTGLSALALSIDGRMKLASAYAPGATAAGGHESSCSCSDPNKKKEAGGCGAGCCGGKGGGTMCSTDAVKTAAKK